MRCSLIWCLGYLVEPPVSGVIASGVNWCIWVGLDCIVIVERDRVRVRAPAQPVGVRSSCLHAHMDTQTPACTGAFDRACRSVLCTLSAVPVRALGLAGYMINR